MENAQTLQVESPSVPNNANSTATKKIRLTPRQSRLLDELMSASGWISRENVDRIAGASNGPQIVMELRRKLTGHDGLDMRKTVATDRDGKTCQPGRYRLNELGRQRVLAAMSGEGVA